MKSAADQKRLYTETCASLQTKINDYGITETENFAMY